MAKRKKNTNLLAQPATQHLPRKEESSNMQIQFKTDAVKLSDEEIRLIKEIQELRNSKVVYFIAGDQVQMRDDISNQSFNLLRELGKNDQIDMILSSRGGQTEVPAKLVPLIRNYCERFNVIIPYRAHSAATHIALGANEIVMGPMSELGPVDPSRTHPLLPKDKDGNPIPISVQDLKHVVDLLKREGPGESYTPEALATIFSTMFQYIHPLAMGAIEQSYALAKLISKKLLETHMDPENDKGKIEKITNELSDGFKSHLYQIGWKEAKSLGLPVVYDNDQVYEKSWNLFEIFSQALNSEPQNSGPNIASRPIVILGTEVSKCVLYELSEIKQEGPLTKMIPIGARWVSTKDLKTV